MRRLRCLDRIKVFGRTDPPNPQARGEDFRNGTAMDHTSLRIKMCKGLRTMALEAELGVKVVLDQREIVSLRQGHQPHFCIVVHARADRDSENSVGRRTP